VGCVEAGHEKYFCSLLEPPGSRAPFQTIVHSNTISVFRKDNSQYSDKLPILQGLGAARAGKRESRSPDPRNLDGGRRF
jgi:hypothetical protein